MEFPTHEKLSRAISEQGEFFAQMYKQWQYEGYASDDDIVEGTGAVVMAIENLKDTLSNMVTEQYKGTKWESSSKLLYTGVAHVEETKSGLLGADGELL